MIVPGFPPNHFFLAALAIAIFPLFSQLTSAAEKPNIVLVMADDQGWGDMAYNGHKVVKTPNFDAAAASGLRFDRFYAAAPVCSPTRASVMTGRHPNRMGVFKWGYPMRPQETTLAEALKTVGYATAHFGKWHLGSVRHDSPASPGKNGFDHWLSAPNFYDNDPILSRKGTAVQMHGESSIVAANAAIDWITQTAERDAPFFAVVWFGSPHSPHRAVDEDRKHYADEPKASQHFLGEITGMDRAFGMLGNHLDLLGIRENTILWYCSDNGALPKVGSSGGHRGNKGTVYEGGLLVPAILQWPAKIQSHRATSMRCNTSDIYPTLLEITGASVQPQAPLDGISLMPLIEAGPAGSPPESRRAPMGFWDYTIKGIGTPSATWMAELLEAQRTGGDLPAHESSQRAAALPDPPLDTTSYPGHSAWIDGDWKLHRIEDKQRRITWELYDLAADRTETNDLIDEKPEIAARLKPAMHAWLASVARSFNGEDYR